MMIIILSLINLISAIIFFQILESSRKDWDVATYTAIPAICLDVVYLFLT